MILNELFDKSKALRFTANEPDKFRAVANIGGREFRFTASKTDDREWEAEFVDENGDAGITGKGNAFEVMACMMKFLRQLIKVKNPGKVDFTAVKYAKRNEEGFWTDTNTSRADLYQRMLERDSFGYHFNWYDLGEHERVFELIKP